MLQFQVSPPKRAPRSIENIENRPSLPSYLILGPHAKVPKIHFQELKLGKSKKEVLIIRNPTETCVNLKFAKKPCTDFTFSCDIDGIITIPENDQFSIEITWTPSTEGHFFEVCQFLNSLNGFKLSVHLLGICTAPPPAFKSVRGKRRPFVALPQSNVGLKVSAPVTTELKKSIPNQLEKIISVAPVQRTKSAPIPIKSTVPANELKTPPKSALQLMDSIIFPFTPEAGVRRETFIVGKEDSIQQPDELGAVRTYTTPPRSGLDTVDSFKYPNTPELSYRRETFIVDKDENSIASGGYAHSEAVIIPESNLNDTDKIRDDLDEAMAELENLENLVRGFVTNSNHELII